MLKDCEKSRFIKEISPIYLDFENKNINKSFVSNMLKEKKEIFLQLKKLIERKIYHLSQVKYQI